MERKFLESKKEANNLRSREEREKQEEEGNKTFSSCYFFFVGCKRNVKESWRERRKSGRNILSLFVIPKKEVLKFSEGWRKDIRNKTPKTEMMPRMTQVYFSMISSTGRRQLRSSYIICVVDFTVNVIRLLPGKLHKVSIWVCHLTWGHPQGE